MPRLSPPRARKVEVEPMPGEATLLDEDVVIELSEDDLAGIVDDIVPEEPETSEPELPEEPSPEDAVANALAAQQRAEELVRTANRERDEAVRRANERQGELERERGDREDAQYNSVLTAIAAEQATLEKAESDYAAFFQSGDATGTAKAQTIMARAAARLDRLEDNKAAIDQQRTAQPRQPDRREAPPSAQPTVDEQINVLKVPENAKTWLRAHPDLMSDPTKLGRLQAVHQYATSVKNVPEFSSQYFDLIETELGLKKPVASATPPAPPAQPQRRSMPVTAPVSRDVPTSSGQRQSATSVTLSAEERRIAHSSFGSINGAKDLTNTEKERIYAQNKLKLQRMRQSGEYPSREQG